MRLKKDSEPADISHVVDDTVMCGRPKLSSGIDSSLFHLNDDPDRIPSGKNFAGQKEVFDENRERYFFSSSLIFWNCSVVISPFAYRSFRMSRAVFRSDWMF